MTAVNSKKSMTRWSSIDCRRDLTFIAPPQHNLNH